MASLPPVSPCGAEIDANGATVGCGYAPGHSTHFIQAKLGWQKSAHWSDAQVTEIRPDGWVRLVLLNDSYLGVRECAVWHHEPLHLSIGDPVALEVNLHMLGISRKRANVVVHFLQAAAGVEQAGGADSSE